MKSMPGYIMVETNGLDLSVTETQTIPGLYSRLTKALATGKAIMLTGLMNGDAEVSPIYVTATLGAGATITLSGIAAVVTDDDEVTPVAS